MQYSSNKLLRFTSSPLKTHRHQSPSWFIFLLPTSTPRPVSFQNKTICGDFTEVLTSLEMLTSSKINTTSKRARWQLSSCKGWLSPPGKGTEFKQPVFGTIPQTPRATSVSWNRKRAPWATESWSSQFTSFIVSYCYHKPTINTTKKVKKKKKAFHCLFTLSFKAFE